MGSEWPTVSLGDITNITSSKRIFAADYCKTGIPFYRSKEVIEKSKGNEISTELFISEEKFKSIKDKFGAPEANDILLTSVGTIGVPYLVRTGEQFYFKDGNLTWLQTSKSEADPKFILIWLQSSVAKQAIDEVTIGSTQQALTIVALKSLSLTLPPLPEQKAIAHILGTLDDKIELNRRMNATLEGMAQALFKSWFVDFDPVIDNALAAGNPIPDELAARAEVRRQALADGTANREAAKYFPDSFQETEAMGWIPEGWEALPLDRVADFKNGLALQKFRPQSGEDPLPIVKIAQLKNGEATWDELASPSISADCIIDDGDVVFSWSGSLMIDVWCGGKAALNQHLFKVTSDNFPKWFYFKWSDEHLNNFQKIAADKAVTMGHIKRSHLSEALCAVPGNHLIKLGAEHFDPILERIISNRLHSRSLTKLRDTLLPKLISGDLRLPEAERLTEQALA